MTASTSTASVAIDARISLDGEKFCFAKFLDRTTTRRVQNHENTICGKAHPPDNRVQSGREIVDFSLWLDITAPIMSALLPHMTTVNTSGTIWTSNETLSLFDIVVDKVATIHQYTDVRIARWTIRAQRGEMPVSLQLDCVASTETEVGAFTASDGGIGQIYAFDDSSYEVKAPAGSYVAYPIDRIAIMSDMNIMKQWNNSTTLTDAILTLQNTYIATTTPYVDSTHNLYWANKSSVENYANKVTFTSGSDELIFEITAGKLMAPKSPDIPSKLSELRLPLTWQAHIDTSTDPDTAAFKFDHTDGV